MAYAIGAAGIVLILVAGVAFANSVRVARVTENAEALHWTNATIGTAALTRAGLVQAVTFAELEARELVDTSDFDFAMDQLTLAVEELEHLEEVGETRDSYQALARFLAPVTAAVADLSNGDFASAKQRVTTDVETSYIELEEALRLEQTRIQAAIDESSELGSAVNGWIVFFLTLAIPASAVAVYYVIARRQMRAIKERNRLELEAERTISRAKDAFIAGLSHELRTPLTSIYGFAEILTDGEIKGPEALEETGQIIANEAAEMTRMVDDLLAASRLESTGVEIEMVRTNIAGIVEEAMIPYRRAGMSIRWEPEAVFAVTDGPRLRHVLGNLLSNAARHGGPTVGIEVTEGEGTVDIEVWDDGSGVPDDRVETMFERFVHGDDAPLLTGSVGLGLAVASRLTGLLEGKLEYQRFGAKTYFTVTLPNGADPSDVDEESPEPVSSKIRALSA